MGRGFIFIFYFYLIFVNTVEIILSRIVGENSAMKELQAEYVNVNVSHAR